MKTAAEFAAELNLGIRNLWSAQEREGELVKAIDSRDEEHRANNPDPMEMQQLRARNAELEAENKKLIAERSCPVLPAGTKVRLSEGFKKVLSVTSRGHLEEFGESVGVVEGLTEYGRGVRGPEVDVRWKPDGLRYAYTASALEVVTEGRG